MAVAGPSVLRQAWRRRQQLPLLLLLLVVAPAVSNEGGSTKRKLPAYPNAGGYQGE